MTWNMRVALGWTVCWGCVLTAAAQEPATRPKAKVELRWLEDKPIEGLTEENGYRVGDEPNDIAYPHKKPALVLTAAEVDEVRLKKLDFSASGNGVVYLVTLHLTKEAREKLATSCKSNEQQALAVAIDGKCWGGAMRYEKDPNTPRIAPECRAATFTPSVGYFSSEDDAQRLVDAFN